MVGDSGLIRPTICNVSVCTATIQLRLNALKLQLEQQNKQVVSPITTIIYPKFCANNRSQLNQFFIDFTPLFVPLFYLSRKHNNSNDIQSSILFPIRSAISFFIEKEGNKCNRFPFNRMNK